MCVFFLKKIYCTSFSFTLLICFIPLAMRSFLYDIFCYQLNNYSFFQTCIIHVFLKHVQIHILNDLLQLTLNVPITRRVVSFSHLLKCLRSLYGNSVDPDQTAPIGAVCSGSTLLLLYLIHQ